MDEPEAENDSKFKIQNYTMRKVKSEPAFPKDGPIVIPPADWQSIDLHNLSTYLKTSLTGDPNDVRSKYYLGLLLFLILLKLKQNRHTYYYFEIHTFNVHY